MRSSGSRASSAMRERARVEPALGACVLVGLVAPRAGGDLVRELAACGARPAAVVRERGDQRLGGRRARRRRRRASTGRCAPIASASRSTWTTRARRREQRAVARRPLVERGAERDDDVGLAEQPRGQRATRSRRRCRARTGRRRTARWRRREVASSAPVSSPSAPQRGPGAGQHGAAAGDDRGPLGLREQVGERRRRRAAGRGGASAGSRRRRRRVALGGLHVERQHQHDGAALDPRAAHRARDVGHRRGRPVHALGDRADRLHEAGLVDAEVRAQRRGGRVGGEHEQRRAALGRLGQARSSCW